MIVQNDQLGTELPQIVVAIITSRMFRAGYPSRIAIPIGSEQGKQSGLIADSVIMTDNLATVQEIAISRRIGSLSMDAVDAALKHTLALT